MATLQSLANDVYSITNRPDLTTETRVALRKAIFKFHGAETFSRDLNRVRLQMALYAPVQPNEFRWAIDLDPLVFPRFRRLYQINYPTDLVPVPNNIPAPLIDWSGLAPDNREVKIVSADNLFNNYRTERYQYAYIAGQVINLHLNWGMDYLDIFYYMWPEVPTDVTDTIDSWICDQFPDAIVEEACSTVFKMIGKDDEAARYFQLFAENMQILRATAVGEDS